MIQTQQRATILYPAQSAYQRNRLLAIVLIAASLIGAVCFAALGILFWPAYTHPFTPYLKWQDALLAILWYLSFLFIISAIVITRFLIALRISQRRGILILQHSGALTLRDVSPKNFASIYSMLTASLTCFLATLVGLSPNILIGWTLHLASPALLIFTTALAITLSLLGLTVTLVSVTFVVISIIGAITLTRNIGAPHTYQLTKQTALRIDSLPSPVLTVTYPDRPETLFDLNLLHLRDQQRLLHLLQQHWLDARSRQPWSPLLGQQIETALQESLKHSTVPV